MASAEELIREAYFAFQSMTPGATDESRHRARAKKLAMRILRKYPVSIEAKQARSILTQMKVDHAATRFVDTHSHSSETRPLAITAESTDYKPSVESNGTDWKSLWRLFAELPYLQKRILTFILLFLILFAAFTPFVLIFAILLIVKRNSVRPLLHKVLVSMGPQNATER